MVLTGAPARAEVVATARSPEGKFAEFRVALDAVGAPAAVANFTGLADGSRKWVDPSWGRVRGGDGDSFYGGGVIDMEDATCVRGGLRAIPDGEGGMKYEGGPGYFVPGKGEEGWTVVEEGSFALVENDGPHSGGGELALFVTNGVTPWTVLGKVPEADLAGLRELAARVQGGEAVGVEWEVDASGATAEEKAALEAGRALLPEAIGMESRVAAGGAGLTFEWPGRSRLLIFTSEELTGGFAAVGDGWRMAEEPGTEGLTWGALGLTGSRGFVTLAGATQPKWTGQKFTGKWWMGLEYPDHQEEIWWDFGDGSGKGTGLVAVVEGGAVTATAKFSQASSWRETGNSIIAYYGRGVIGYYHYLGFAEEGAQRGRFMYRLLKYLDEVGRTWGTFEMEEGWAREPGVVSGVKCRGTEAAGSGIPAGRAAKRTEPRTATASPEERPREEGGIRVRGKGGARRPAAWRGGETWRSGGVEELDVGIFGEGDVRAEEIETFFDLGEKGGGAGEGGGAEGGRDIGIEGDGIVESPVEGEGDGEGVPDDGVVGGEAVGAAGDGEDVGGGGG